MTERAPKIAVRHLYKIFGDDPQAVLPLVKDGMAKPDLLAEHNHVLGLNDINVDIEAGEITVIMGLSGSGKSTLIRHFNRLIEPTDGEILLDGEDIMALDRAGLMALRQTRMSMVFQKFALFPHKTVLENTGLAPSVRYEAAQSAGLMPHLTILQNVGLGPRIRGEAREAMEAEARKWLETVGLQGYEDYYPGQLSGGMQQRVGLARALTSNAEIMLMDEAFSALDPLIRTEMQDLLLELQRSLHKTIVFISHDLDEALKLADHLVILKDGVVVQAGEPQGVLLNPCDPYIEDFVSDINRARVLRVRSIMHRLNGAPPPRGAAGEVDADDTLESVIALSGGDTTLHYTVTRARKPVGVLHMRELVRALVPRAAAEGGVRGVENQAPVAAA